MLLALLPIFTLPVTANTYPNCVKVKFTATATATNYQIPFSLVNGLLDLLHFNIDLPGLLNVTLGGPLTYTSSIVARYCEPEVKIDGRADKLEILLHSITNNKDFWSGLGEPGQGYQGDSYSWIAYASKQGYATLSLDRLGNGESDHPDPILVVQGPYEEALYHEIIQQIKSGKNSPLPRTYDDITLVGNSYGSVLIDNIAYAYPDDAKRVILTGYTLDVDASFPGVVAVAPLPASIAIPERFGNLPLGYLATTSPGGRQGAFYGLQPTVRFDPGIVQLDIQRRDVVSVGQFISNYLPPVVADKFKGRALVLTGEEDNAFCGPGDTLLFYPRRCRNRIPDTRKLFPAADYSYYSVGYTGHSNNFHYSRNETFRVAHDFIGGASFAVANAA